MTLIQGDPRITFSFGELLHRDSQGRTHAAIERETGTPRACVEVSCRDLSARERRLVEAEALALCGLTHEYVVRHYMVYDWVGHEAVCLVTDFYQHTLLDMLRQARASGTYLPERVIWTIAAQVLAALLYCHLPRKGGAETTGRILHKNIRPASIYITGGTGSRDVQGLVCHLGAFGILNLTAESLVHQERVSMYSAPEVHKHGLYSEKSDVWELGIVLYEACAKKRPFTSVDRGALHATLVFSEYERIPGRYSNDLSEFIDAMLSPELSTRASVSDLLMHPKIAGKLEDAQHNADQRITGTLKKIREIQIGESQTRLQVSAIRDSGVCVLPRGTILSPTRPVGMRTSSVPQLNSPRVRMISTQRIKVTSPSLSTSMLGQSSHLYDVEGADNSAIAKLRAEVEQLAAENRQLRDALATRAPKPPMASVSRPLQFSTEAIERSIADLFIDLPDPESRKTVLMGAAEAGLVYVVSRLVETQARQQDAQGRTALMYAIQGGSLRCVELLVASEARMVDHHGRSALIYAIATKDIELVQLLVEQEASINLPSGVSPRDVAISTGDKKIIALLARDVYKDPTPIPPKFLTTEPVENDANLTESFSLNDPLTSDL
ncbi:Kinase, NEK [Giardia muris]|uniref:non-specific serine/threonine protein kinase n=1 Tax=Giardia muris TaxID=5742 RepID=A0A4Z1T0W9_GIAMU|nr:Kinase, NEK [Giardia muris]|eukprot:TNJ27553.1 Kinase, NEK [Giardia muris]